MNALESINVAIEFVSKQVDPGGGGTVTPAAPTGDFAIFAIIVLVLTSVLAFAMFKVSSIYNFGTISAGNHVKSKNVYFNGRFSIIVPIILAICMTLIASLGIVTTKAIAANASNGLVIQPDKIQIPIDEATGQPDPASFIFINNSSDNFYFETSLMSLTNEAKSLSSPEDWGINITGLNQIIYAGEPDGETTYEIKNILPLKPAQSMVSILTFTKFDVDLAKKLIGKQVFSLSLNDNDKKVAPNPKVNTGLIYNGWVQTGVELLEGYTLEGITKATNAGIYKATAKLADGYDVWEDGTTDPIVIYWIIDKAQSVYTLGNEPVAAQNLYYTGQELNLLSNNGKTECGTIMYSTDGSEFSEDFPTGVDASIDEKPYYVVKVMIIGDSNHYNSKPITFNVKIDKVVVKNMIVLGTTVTVTFDGKEHMCPEVPETQPFYTVKYDMEEGYEIDTGVEAKYVLTDSPITPAKGSEVDTYYLGIGETYKLYYADSNNVEIKNWVVNDGFLKIKHLHENLYEYTPSELKEVSDYLGTLPESKYATDSAYKHFEKFMNDGLSFDGSDNAMPMKKEDGSFNDFAKNHWAIDSQGRIATDENFANDSIDTIQARIIGICHDKDEYDKRIGLTMMTTHSLSVKSPYEVDGSAYYGWSGDDSDSSTSSCTLRAMLAAGTLFPKALKDAVKIAAKGYQYSSVASSGNNTAYDKFWAPSMAELYGSDDPSHSTKWWSATSEGSQYSAFKNKSIIYNSYAPFARLDGYQSGGERTYFVRSRSLCMGSSVYACNVNGSNDEGPGSPHADKVEKAYGVVACFCFGTEPPVPFHKNLYEYTPGELKEVSDYLAELPENKYATDSVYKHFEQFMNNGLSNDGSDNAMPMKKDDGTFNDFAKNHWAIDINGNIATKNGFDNKANTTIQARIIGICHDKDKDGNNIGLTMMTTHSLSVTSAYEADGTAIYGWSGDDPDSSISSCTLRAMLAEGTLFPQALKDVVKTAEKWYQYSNDANNKAYDKFWAPSMAELYGSDLAHTTPWWSDDSEGSQYLSFKNNGITYRSYAPFARLDGHQNGGSRTGIVRSRSLWPGNAKASSIINASSKLDPGSPTANHVINTYGVVACFCI